MLLLINCSSAAIIKKNWSARLDVKEHWDEGQDEFERKIEFFFNFPNIELFNARTVVSLTRIVHITDPKYKGFLIKIEIIKLDLYGD